MRVLLDEQLPRQLAPALTGHDVRTVKLQQNLTKRRIGVVVLRAPSNALEDLLPLVPSTLKAIEEIKPGQVIRVEA